MVSISADVARNACACGDYDVDDVRQKMSTAECNDRVPRPNVRDRIAVAQKAPPDLELAFLTDLPSADGCARSHPTWASCRLLAAGHAGGAGHLLALTTFFC